MTTLGDYRNGKLQIQLDDQLFLDRFENLFSKLHNGENVVHLRDFPRESTHRVLVRCIENLKLKPGKKVLLFTNPDTDIPAPKIEFINQDFIPFTESLQKNLEEQPLENLLDCSLLNHLREDVKVFCNAVIVSGRGLSMIPIGRDWKGKEVLLHRHSVLNRDREILCYFNCSTPPMSVHWYGRIRSYIDQFAESTNFITRKLVGQVTSRHLSGSVFESYYSDLENTEFMICPRGCSLDTYRLWDCLYFGVIPIVVKYDGYRQFENLPILFIDNWRDYLSLDEQFLRSARDKMLDQDYDYDQLKFSWWQDRISSSI